MSKSNNIKGGLMTVISRFGPFRDLTLLQDRINRLFEDNIARQEGRTTTGEVWMPMIDITEDDNEIVLWVDLPGMSQNEVEITVSGDQLTLKGERKGDQENTRKLLRRERIMGPFSRTFELNLPVEVDKVTASYKNGVLEIHLPKSAETKPRKITINPE